MPANRRFYSSAHQPEQTPKSSGSSRSRSEGWRARINRNDGRWFQVDNRALQKREALALGLLPIGVVLLPGVIPALRLPLIAPVLIILTAVALLLWGLKRN